MTLPGERPFPLHPTELSKVVLSSTHYKPRAQELARRLAVSAERLGAKVLTDYDGVLPLQSMA